MGNLVSIILTVFNSQEFLRDCLESVTNQTYTNLEIIIVNDASKDASLDIIGEFAKRDSRIVIINNKENLGYLKSINLGFETAKGVYITTNDSDDVSELTRIQKQVEFIEKYDCLGVFVNTLRFKTMPKDLGEDLSITHLSDSKLRNEFLHYPVVIGPFLFHRRVYDEMGGYHMFFDRIGGEHLHWADRMLFEYPEGSFKFYSEVLYHYRVNPGSITNTSDRIEKFYVNELISFLNSQRLNDGKDGLSGGDYASFVERKNELHEIYTSNPDLLLYILIYRHISNGRFKDGLGEIFSNPRILINVSNLFSAIRVLKRRKENAR